jgi:cell division protein FtsZ
MARNRASMREGPLAELFRATEAAQRQSTPAKENEKGEQQELAVEPPLSPPTPAAEPPRERSEERVRAEKPRAEKPRAEKPRAEKPRAPEPTPIRSLAPAPDFDPEPAQEERRTDPPKTARWLDPLPDQPARLERARDTASYAAVIRVVGVGGAGLNAVDRMIDAGITQVDFIAVNTDIQQLQMSDAATKIHIGSELTEGLGSGADPEIGRRSAEDGYDAIKRSLRGSDMVFVTAGEGGGTGSGAAPVVARVAREVGALTVGIVTMPFKFEGSRRKKQAQDGLQLLREACDTLIVVPNDRLLEVLDKSTSMLDAFRIADDVLRHGVQGICDLITNPGLINLDFADVRTIMADSGSALMGIGYATGENRAKEAAERALRSPLIEEEITGARGILLSIAGGDDLTLYEVNEAAEAVREAATDETNIIFGATIDDRLEGQIWITVVATGIGKATGRRGTFVTASSGGSAEVLDTPSFLRD